MPLVRWHSRLEESQRKHSCFRTSSTSKGKAIRAVTVGTLAASTEIYSIGLRCKPEEIHERWTRAQSHPIAPVQVERGPVQEVIWKGDDLLNGHGLDMLPVPISTPGFDNGPYLTSANWVTKDPDTGIFNIGNYRSQIKPRIATADCF
jgi:4-hydroxy-3-polyprenylbenzoate decarboxylase